MTHDFPPPKSEILETFEDLEDWEERYEFLLDLGRELPALESRFQADSYKVHGCMSTVWLAIEPETSDGNPAQHPIVIYADSDSLIVKGLIVILLSLYQGRTPEESIAVDPGDFFGQLGLNQHLSPNRRNGLYSMVGRIRELCVQLAAGVA